MNFHINTKELQALSYADLEALYSQMERYEKLRSTSAVIPLYTPELCTEFKAAIYHALNTKILANGLVSIFKGNSITEKVVLDVELSLRVLNVTRKYFGLHTNDNITVQHIKTIYNLGFNNVSGLGMTGHREIKWFLEKLGV